MFSQSDAKQIIFSQCDLSQCHNYTRAFYSNGFLQRIVLPKINFENSVFDSMFSYVDPYVHIENLTKDYVIKMTQQYTLFPPFSDTEIIPKNIIESLPEYMQQIYTLMQSISSRGITETPTYRKCRETITNIENSIGLYINEEYLLPILWEAFQQILPQMKIPLQDIPRDEILYQYYKIQMCSRGKQIEDIPQIPVNISHGHTLSEIYLMTFGQAPPFLPTDPELLSRYNTLLAKNFKKISQARKVHDKYISLRRKLKDDWHTDVHMEFPLNMRSLQKKYPYMLYPKKIFQQMLNQEKRYNIQKYVTTPIEQSSYGQIPYSTFFWETTEEVKKIVGQNLSKYYTRNDPQVHVWKQYITSHPKVQISPGTCPICLSEEEEFIIPKCSDKHKICLKCYTEMEKSSDDTISCPFCRQKPFVILDNQ